VHWFAPDRAAVTLEGSASVAIIDPLAGQVVDKRPTGQDVSHMVAVSGAPPTAYIANIGSGSVSVVRLTDASAARSIRTGAGSEGIATTPDGGQVWVTAREAGTVTAVDASTLEALGRLDVPGVPIRVVFSPDGARAYVTCAGRSELVVFDVATRREVGRTKIDVARAPGATSRPFAAAAAGSALPVGVAVSRDGRSVYVAATMGDQVVELDAATLSVLRTIAVDGEPDGLGLTDVMPKSVCHACTPDTTQTGER
jgi:YVTN family beta-propeller protein